MTAKAFILIKGELVQDTAGSFGGNGDDNWVDDMLCRDGQGRYTLRGESLAGALSATARQLFSELPKEIGDKSSRQPSAWRVFTSHPAEGIQSSVRQNVCIDKQTGAAMDGALFDTETLPAGTRWPFILEIDLTRAGDNVEKLLAVTLHALSAWVQGRCWIGRNVARGTGWFSLENIKITHADWEQWPNSSECNIDAYYEQSFPETQSLVDFMDEYAGKIKPDADWLWQEYQLTIRVDVPENDAYGIDFLSVGGHSGDALMLDIQEDLVNKEKLALPQASLNDSVCQNWVADQVFSYLRNTDGNIQPYIAGASLRGVLRHGAEWWANKHNIILDDLDTLFGTLENSARLLISDVHISDANWQALLLKMHAEDEFSGGVYASALFDRLVLSQACFTGKLLIEAKQEDMQLLEKSIQPALELAKLGFLGLGGQSARGMGHLKWDIQRIPSTGEA